MRARMYEPRLGRFTQTDPLSSTRGFRHYTYAGNNPVSMNDPLGLQNGPRGEEVYAYEPTKTEQVTGAISRFYNKWVNGYWRQQWSSDEAKEGEQIRAAHLQYFFDRTQQTIQVGRGGIEVAVSVETANPVLAVHGIDLIGTGIIGWSDGRVHQTAVDQVMEDAMEKTGVPTDLRPMYRDLANNVGPFAAPAIANQGKNALRMTMSKTEEILTRTTFPGASTVRPTLLLDENSLYMRKGLEEAGWTVRTPVQGTEDIVIRSMVENDPNLVLITQNYKHFKGLPKVVRVGSLTPEKNLEQTLTSLEGVMADPSIFNEFPQIPASGLNAGHFFKKE